MDPEQKALLEENLRVSKETNALLKSMNRWSWIGFIGRAILWAVLIILPLLLLPMLLAPYLEVLQGMQNGGSSINIENLQNILDQYKVE